VAGADVEPIARHEVSGLRGHHRRRSPGRHRRDRVGDALIAGAARVESGRRACCRALLN
jgi:hypothetical protein